jgi:ankyrin repeat protein
MLRDGADVNSLDEANRTAIYDAVLNDQPQIAALLLKSGAKLNVKDVNGKSPMQYAGDPAMKKLLHRAGGE